MRYRFINIYSVQASNEEKATSRNYCSCGLAIASIDLLYSLPGQIFRRTSHHQTVSIYKSKTFAIDRLNYCIVALSGIAINFRMIAMKIVVDYPHMNCSH